MTETVTIGFLINGMYALCDSKHHTRPLTHYSLTHSLTHSLPLSLTDIITTCLLYMCCLTVTSCLNHHDWDSHDVGYYRLSNVTQNILPTHSLPHYSLIHPLTYLLTHPLTHLITCTHPLTHCLSPTHSLTASSHIHRYMLHVLLYYCLTEKACTQSGHDHFYGAVTILCSIGELVVTFVSYNDNVFLKLFNIKKSDFINTLHIIIVTDSKHEC